MIAGGGNYFPLTAAQRWDASTGEIENGIYLGLLAALTFQGAYEMRGVRVYMLKEREAH